MWVWMWKLNCGCNPPIQNWEITIVENKKSNYKKIKLPNTSDKTQDLKCEIIQDFLDIIDKLECGIQPDLQEILEELSILEMNNGSFNISKKIYSTYEDEGDNLLRKNKYLSEFETEEDRKRALQNLGIDTVKHIILDRSDFENLSDYDQNAIYFITE